jgi:signal transduction histidine kinase
VVAFLIVLIVLPLVFLWATYRTEKLSAQIVAVEESRLLVSRALRYAIDEESGVRGYLDTREPLFLRPLSDAHPALGALLHILPARFAAADFKSAIPAIEDFKRQHDAWYATVVQPLLADPGRRDHVALEQSGRRFMQNMRADAMSIHSGGAVLAAQAARRTSGVITIAIVLSALWILFVAILTTIMQRRAVRHQNILVESLVREREEVAHLSEWRARLLAMLAHDFKSQLAVLIGASHLLEDFPQRRADLDLLASLRNASYALAEMADNAILLAHAQERKILLHPTAFDIGEIVDAVVQRYGDEREFHLHRSTPTAMVHADRSYVARVLDNIIGNAVKYSDQPVHVYLLDSPEFIKVTVVDRGVGIAPEDIPHIFEEFWRSDRVSLKRGGSGIGLFIVKTIMEAHGGAIDVESEFGKGTTVTLKFPRALAAFVAAQPPVPA